MKMAGTLLMLAGVAMALFAFFMDTTVSTTGTYVGGQLVGGGSTHNLGLMQQQMMVLHTGLAAFVGGAILFGSGAVAPEKPEPVYQNWTDVHEGETEGDRDERVARQKMQDRVILAIFVGLVLVGLLFVFFG